MEQVILVDEHDKELGIMEKMEAHQKALLHRAFSIFIFNTKGELLLQQRSICKYHSGDLWTNSCCSHPRPGEITMEAAERRLQEELGFTTPLEKVFNFIYKTSFMNGLTEHEYDHAFVGYYNGPVHPDAKEVENYAYRPMSKIEQALQTNPDFFTSWFHIAFPNIMDWWKQHYT